MAPRKRTTAPAFSASEFMAEHDPIEQVMAGDDVNIAGSLENILDELGTVITEDAKVFVYKGAKGVAGQWAWCMTLTPPINVDSILDTLRNDWGAGSYQLRIRAKGRIVTTKQLDIAGDPEPRNKKKEDNSRDMTDLLLQQAATSKTDMMQMMQIQMQMMQAGNQQMIALMTVMMGGKDKTSEVMSALAPFMVQKQGGMEETIKTMVAMKELLGDGNGGGGDKSFFEQAAGALLPAIAGAATGMMGQQGGEQPQFQPMPQQQFLPPQSHPQQPQTTPSPIPSDPLIRLIAPEVLFYAARGFDPDAAADQVVTTLQTNQVPIDAINSLVVRLGQSPDWIASLAQYGLDLRQHREWAQQFLQSLVTRYQSVVGANANSVGQAGGTTNVTDDGETGA